MLNLFYITNEPEVAKIADKYGVNRVCIDLETLGKKERQKLVDSVKSKHIIADIATMKPILKNAELMVRINPWNPESFAEIENVIKAGADIIMLPMWRSVDEVRQFLMAVNGRVKTSLLLETKEAVECVDNIFEYAFDEIHIGLNDLHLSYGLTFMFELFLNGVVESLCEKFKTHGVPYGVGGIGRIGAGLLPAEMILMEHYRLGSTRAILSRSFCDINKNKDFKEVDYLFKKNLKLFREYEEKCLTASNDELLINKCKMDKCIKNIVIDLKRKGENEEKVL